MLEKIKKLLPGRQDTRESLRQQTQQTLRARLQHDAATLHGAVQSLRYCCKTDQPYSVRYVKDDAGSRPFARAYRWFDSQKIHAQGNGQAAADTSHYARLSHSDCNTHEEICPWCGAQGIVFCGNELVCQGRVQRQQQGEYFRCRDSCGRTGWLEPCDKDIPVTREANKAPSNAATLPPRGQKPQGGGTQASIAPANTTKPLGAASNQRLLK